MPHSALIKDVLDRRARENSSLLESLRICESGLILNKLEVKSRHEKRLFRVQLDLFAMVWVSVKDSNQIEGLINIRDIKEIRTLRKTLDENKILKGFAIFYGKKFKLKELTAFGESS